MQIGLMMRSGNQGASGAVHALRWPELREMAVLAEDIGIDTLGAPDHLLFRNAPPVSIPEGQTRGTWECFTLLSALAGVTRRVTLLPLVACTSFRNPALLAKIADSLDEVSEGRLLLGLGAGWHEPEYAAYGYPFGRRVSRFEEALRPCTKTRFGGELLWRSGDTTRSGVDRLPAGFEAATGVFVQSQALQIIVPLLKGESVTFNGSHYSVDNCVLVPRGPRPGGPPIWIGARRPRMLGLVAKYADAYHTDMLLGLEGTQAAEDLLRIADDGCRAVGRDPATLRKTSGCSLAVEGADELGERLPDPIMRGSGQQIVDQLGTYAALGIDHFTFWMYPWTPRAIEQLAPIVEAAHKL